MENIASRKVTPIRKTTPLAERQQYWIDALRKQHDMNADALCQVERFLDSGSTREAWAMMLFWLSGKIYSWSLRQQAKIDGAL